MYEKIGATDNYEVALSSWGGSVRSVPYGKNIDGNSSITPPFSRDDYEHWRPDDALPTSHPDIMAGCLFAYETVGPVRNIIDLMSDFGTAGITLTHPNSKVETFFKNWFLRVKGAEVSERILNNLFKFATAIVRRSEISLRKRLRQEISTSLAGEQNDLERKWVKTGKMVPSAYRLLNPCMVDIVGGHLSMFMGVEPTYGIRVPWNLRQMIKEPRNALEREFVSKLPDEIVELAKKDMEMIPLDSSNLRVLHYKKDDWQAWAKPIIYSVLYDIKLLQKLKLADFSSLDSAMDMVRIYKLGSMDHQIIPGPAIFKKLAESVEATNAGGIRNIIWGPDIELVESKNNAFAVLGEEKYRSSWDTIHSGLGIPPSVTGTAGGGTTNNLISLKTLIKRLAYGRQKLIDFWTEETERVRIAAGWSEPVKIEFDIMNLGDEEAEKRLWIDLADRNIVSDEWVQQKLGAHPVIEKNRLNKEHRDRLKNKRVPKSSPWHDPQMEEKMRKGLLEQGRVGPRDVGLDLDERTPEFEGAPPQERVPSNTKTEKQLRQPAGRPAGTPDSQPRRRRFVPQTRATLIWAAEAQSFIGRSINEAVLASTGKKNMRKLSAEEARQTEALKVSTLLQLPPMTSLSDTVVAKLVGGSLSPHLSEFRARLSQTEELVGRPLNQEERAEIARELYLEIWNVES